ncbi:MAG: thioesterase family protein [Neisseria sp.]|nr:thioesterase family protein [Neisseria sp.]
MDLNQTFRRLADHDTVALDPSWAQGRAAFGGLTAALMLVKLQHAIGSARVLRSFSASFVGPIDTGGEITLSARVLRVGKSVVQGEAHLLQNGEVRAAMLASFGEARESAVYVPYGIRRPRWPAPESVPPLPEKGAGMPAFLHHIDLRWAYGPLPYSGADNADFGGYMRLKNQQGDFTLAHLVALVDAWPPAVTTLLKTPAPASSLTWTLELLQEPQEAAMADFWQYQVHTDFCRDGYGHTDARVWDKHGNPILISRQTVTVFA